MRQAIRCRRRISVHLHVLFSANFNPSYFGRFYARWRECEKRLVASSCLSVCPSAWNSAANGWILMKFDICVFFENLFRKSKLRSNLQEKRVLYMKAYVHLWYIPEFFLEWEMFKTKVVEKIKTHFIFNHFFPERRSVYETRGGKNLYGRTVHRWQYSRAQKRCDFHAR